MGSHPGSQALGIDSPARFARAETGTTGQISTMTNWELEQRCLEVIQEATTRMQDAPSAKMREKWRVVRDSWMELLKRAQGTPSEP
jgi:hypothetical protein